MNRARDGFALFAAVWLLVALGAVSLELSIRSASERSEALHLSEGARARAIARSALEVEQAKLQHRLEGRTDASTWRAGAVISLLDPWSFTGSRSADTLLLDGTLCRITMIDAGTRLNLNTIDESQFRRLLTALRLDAARIDKIIDAIMDWRDPDDLRRANGAERDEYVAAGAPVLPRNGPFTRVEELLFVRGIDASLYQKLREYLSVVGSGVVNINSADAAVLASLPGMSDEAVAAVIARRRSGHPIMSLDELASSLSGGARALLSSNSAALIPRISFLTREVLLHGDAGPQNGSAVAHLDGLIVRGGNYAYVVWRRIS